MFHTEFTKLQNKSKWFLCDFCLNNIKTVKMYNSINSPWYLKNYIKENDIKLYLCHKCTPKISFNDIIYRIK